MNNRKTGIGKGGQWRKPVSKQGTKQGGKQVELQNEKCVMIIDENMPLGIIANTAAIMGITLGKEMQN